MTRSRPAHPRQLWLAWMIWICALSLLAAQGLGHWHRIAHGGTFEHTSTPSAAADGWGHQSGSVDCHLFDQLGHDQAPGSSFVQVCMPLQHLSPETLAPADAATASRWKRGARGPPLFA